MKTETTYLRVLPRDLFNEAKLLKCIGHLVLKIHDNSALPCEMAFTESGKRFKIELLPEGSLTIANYHISIKGKIFLFKTTYNSKAPYPLFLEYDNCDYPVFDESGNFDSEFIAFCETVNPE